MFNTPILDIAIGLIFIFLLYSLLATSIKEAIATALSLRARMLKKGIIAGMLSDTPDYSTTGLRWKYVLTGFFSFLANTVLSPLLMKVGGNSKKKSLGSSFYDHPLLKNYGSGGLFRYPSYLPTTNFSLILVDTLKKEFNDKLDSIATWERAVVGGTALPDQFRTDLINRPDMDKIKLLLQHYAYFYALSPPPMTVNLLPPKAVTPANCMIDKDTVNILLMHLRNSLYSLDNFKKTLESWFDDSMDRVSGWYKRQVQIILFVIGFVLAFAFNVDTLSIIGKLSKDDKLRDQVVQSAIAYSKAHADQGPAPDSNGRKTTAPTTDTADVISVQDVKAKFKRVDDLTSHDIKDINSLLAIGYGDYGAGDTGFIHEVRDKMWITWLAIVDAGASEKDIRKCIYEIIDLRETSTHPDTTNKKKKPDTNDIKRLSAQYDIPSSVAAFINGKRLTKGDSTLIDSIIDSRFIQYQLAHYPLNVKTAYMWHTLSGRKWLSFLILALAVCLGAPFWFDMLNKVINLRGAGKKEGSSEPAGKTSPAATPGAITINNQSTGQEAVG